MVPLVRSPAHCWDPQSHNPSFSSSVSTSVARGLSESGTKGTETAALREGGGRDRTKERRVGGGRERNRDRKKDKDKKPR